MAMKDLEVPVKCGWGLRAALRHVSNDPWDKMQERINLMTAAAAREPGNIPLIGKEMAKQCQKIAKIEAEHLPKNRSEERVARNRMPRSQSEAMLRRGAPLTTAATNAALRVLERWVVLLSAITNRQDLAYLFAALVHGVAACADAWKAIQEQENKAQEAKTRQKAAAPDGATERKVVPIDSLDLPVEVATPRLQETGQGTDCRGPGHWAKFAMATPNPTPSAEHPLGAALRRVVPHPLEIWRAQNYLTTAPTQKRPRGKVQLELGQLRKPAAEPSTGWEFLDNILEAVAMQKVLELEPNWPNTAERKTLQCGRQLDVGSEAPFIEAKTQEIQTGQPGRRAPLASDLRLRLSSDSAWATFRSGQLGRATWFGQFSPQLFLSQQQCEDEGEKPGPGYYSMRATDSAFASPRRGRFPPVGAPRPNASEMTFGRGRWLYPTGDPYNMCYPECNSLW